MRKLGATSSNAERALIRRSDHASESVSATPSVQAIDHGAAVQCFAPCVFGNANDLRGSLREAHPARERPTRSRPARRRPFGEFRSTRRARTELDRAGAARWRGGDSRFVPTRERVMRSRCLVYPEEVQPRVGEIPDSGARNGVTALSPGRRAPSRCERRSARYPNILFRVCLARP